MTFNISRFRNIEKVTYECEVVTPMFLSGADQSKAELRTQSIKGALRFWWRAIFASDDITQMKLEESKIFGDSDDVGKSRLKISLGKTIKYKNSRYCPIPHKNVNFSFPCLDVGERFIINFSGTSKTKSLFEIVSLLGGLGKRSRRGFGSFGIIKKDENSFEKEATLNNILEMCNFISPGKFRIDNNRIVLNQNVAAAYPFIKKIVIGSEYQPYESLLKVIGQASHTYNCDNTGFAKGQTRQASPVYVSVVADGKGCKPIITVLNTAFPHGWSPDRDKSNDFIDAIIPGGAI